MTGSTGTRWLSYRDPHRRWRRVRFCSGDLGHHRGRRRRRHAPRRTGVRVHQDGGRWKQVAELRAATPSPATTSLVSVHLGHDCRSGCLCHAKSSGRVYVFSESTGWKQIAELKCADTLAGDQFGSGGDLRHDHGGRCDQPCGNPPDGVRVHQDGGRMEADAKLEGSDTAAGDHFGWSVGVSGTTAIVGGFLHPRVRRHTWFTETPAAGDKSSSSGQGHNRARRIRHLGWNIGCDRCRGRHRHAGGAGRVYVFTQSPSGWKQVAELKGSAPPRATSSVSR